jgi:hypothetical protein
MTEFRISKCIQDASIDDTQKEVLLNKTKKQTTTVQTESLNTSH